ncbi:MAG TPA: OmpA family protein [Stellaceae bacterium]|jgi:outer membrane protein OmpA-like peptidoglycan-associated protein|nr:OmpA family protein [Stellaceae bacterium]
MRYTVNAAAAGAILLAWIAPAGAQAPPGVIDWTGPYVGLNVGPEWSRLPGRVSAGGSGTGLANPNGANVTGGGQAGYNYQLNNFVLGVEGDIRGGGPSNRTSLPGGAGSIPAGTTFNSSSDWNASLRGRVGYAWNQFLFYGTGGIAFANANVDANYGGGGGHASNSTTLMGPTYGGGVEYAVTPNVSVGGEYRYTDYGHDTVHLGSVATGAGTTAPATGRIGLQDNTLLLKVNYRFGAAPPPPPPEMPVAAPAPAPAAAPRVFIVFFDWDKDTITPQGMQIVQQAADAYRSGAPVQIQVTGYTDRSGSAAYNQRLSERRANNVARALAGLGVPRQQMAVSGRGENDNRVPTAAGVREPQNRRVEITAP